METIEKMNVRKEMQKAYIAYQKHLFHCENILQMAIDILESKGVNANAVFHDFSCSYVAGDKLCFTIEYNNKSPYIIPCLSFFQYFEESYKEGDNIVEELLKIAIY